MAKIFNYLSLLILIVTVSCGGPELPDDVALAYEKLPKQLDFNQHVKPILSDKCFLCHGPDEAKISAGLQLHLPDLAFKESENNPGKYAIVPGNAGSSLMIDRILSDDPELVMPVPESHLTLTEYEKAVLVRWIEDGAEYKDHWAFISPKEQNPPKVKLEDKIVNPIDNFILAKLELENLETNERANKETILRRLTFDLTGLPPTLDEINTFINDDSPNAFEIQVDRLLSSQHYGEQMALDWMDLSRYADTNGYTVDRYRDVSPYRDWVIKSFNTNVPYDQFIRWQLAGDMMPNATKEQILATTFNRLHPQNGEGGIIDEEFRSEYVSDRTNVVSEGLMGLTMACAKCHDHKYDPISQKNYFEMYSFFNNQQESGQISYDWSMPAPTLLLPNKEQEQFLSYIEKLINDKEQNVKVASTAAEQEAQKWINNEGYQKINPNQTPKGLIAKVDFNNGQLVNKIKPFQKGKMERQYSTNQTPSYTKGFDGKGLQLDGDAWLNLGKVGIFQRHEPFSVGIRIYVPKDLETGVIFHKGIGAKLFNFRGYHLAIKDNKIEALLAHLHPGNAIVKYSLDDIPKEKWIQLTMTYDGSSTANGLHIYLDGKILTTETEIDNLYKDIVFNKKAHGMKGVPDDPGLQIGARWRGKGIGGAVVDDITVFERELNALEILQIANKTTIENLIKKPINQLSTNEKNDLLKYYIKTNSKTYTDASKSLKQTRKTYVDSVDRIQDIMVMKEMKSPRPSFILERGQYDVHGEQVYPNTPEKIFAFPDSLEKNRLGLAKWVTDKANPLTARVAVNRYWKNIFGTGLVRTVEDFGNQGELPSHPALLDWLAIEFMNSGWDVKKLHKLMVMSNTYRQSSVASSAQLSVDKPNRLLARGPSKRLTGEMLRNNALVASGLMNKTIGGPSVSPYQPKGLWKINGSAYQEDTGEKLYRKSMYTIWKRSVPHPTIATFDTPDRSLCTVRRQETNTPLQALVMLNDPTYVETSRVLGYTMLSYSNVKEGIAAIFKKLTGRNAQDKELNLLADLQLKEYENFKSNKSKTDGWLNTGEFRISNKNDAAMVAANAVVASTIMNSDATITKR
ncbi:DUF1553 domain-containing protein [Aurantibacter crassamenti]|uniref:DUF1553 domain-containing protein n=1 Tax=Aurantibacter crassamenti TaxID=1837375 RepID=UPI00193A9C72|nr:DUF1553 domain-containing protein [Aurantibacter crassamenti]MBM1107727.1 DUF1553 domain-containing protein [Aurantibacter crassamenti]